MPSDKLANSPALARWEPVEQAGEGASSVVWKVKGREAGAAPVLGALKVARGAAAAFEALRREATLLARIGRRWGPSLLDAGPGFLVTSWTEGRPLDEVGAGLTGKKREALVAQVAHGVARALDELHQAGVHHGDVKPGNVLLADRSATLIDLGLAGDIGAPALGGTPRYAAPELRAQGEAGPAADLWALGILLAELLDPRVSASGDPRAAIAAWSRAAGEGEPARWIEALVAASPGGRPGAAWVASRAARWLGLSPDEAEERLARVDRVRRTYLSAHAADLAVSAPVAPVLTGPARDWLGEALAWAHKLAPAQAAGTATRETIEPLGTLRTARWLVCLVGPAAAAWPLRDDPRTESELVARALELARVRDPSAFTLDDLLGTSAPAGAAWEAGEGDARLVRLVGELSRSTPAAAAIDLAENELASGRAPSALAIPLARTLTRAGETGRAWAALSGIAGADADALRAEIARRRGETGLAIANAEHALGAAGPSVDPSTRASASATLARVAWDRGDLVEAEARLVGHGGPAIAEVRALVAWRRGTYEPALEELRRALSGSLEADVRARLEAAAGLLELARGSAAPALASFGRAVEHATRAGALVEEATYLTSEAAAATDVGDMARALASATRAALLWERLGRPSQAARAWLARAGALATLGAAHGTDEAATEACARALASRDARAAAYARWAQVEVRPAGDEQARSWAVQADEALRDQPEDRARSGARLLVWAPAAIDDVRVAATDEQVRAMPAPVRWEWWGARAAAMLAGRKTPRDGSVLGALVALAGVPAPLSSRGPALDAAVRLATELGDGESARRLEVARQAAAQVLREGTPPGYLSSLAAVTWARSAAIDPGDVAFAPAQVAQLESIVRSLSGRDRLRPLLEQVLDTLVLWTGVERGLLLLRAPDGRLVPRAARNLARKDLTGEQLVLSQTIARRAIEEGTAIVATDAFSTLGDVHASVHALRLRSVLAVPLVARGETLGVVYLDDRGRKGAFGPRELAWVRVVASQAAMAIADARDAVLLRRAVGRAERARARVESMLAERDAELSATRTQLELTHDGRETRFAYDEIAGRSEPMRELLHLVDKVTASEVPVLVVGESGTGKELIARAVHANGSRARRPFVSENCASVPETLLETTLFGHVRGAFTGASATRAGLFDVADGGTLFLDEIGEMPLSMQAKLLRVLQDGVVRPVGGERERKVDVRVIAATHRDLEAMVAAGTFREDLLYRLNVITLRVPALRERPEDIPLLVDHLVAKHAAGRKVKITRAAMAKLTTFAWPGNVRQLENEVRRALVLGDGVIDVPELSAEVARGGPGASRSTGLDLRARVDALEAELVVEALGKTRGNQTRAAQVLGLSRFGLQKMMKRLKVKAPAG
jgi:transcriptional regulator with GAF, ATPase, and Fis domain/tetratricopeptide (TPR) repeat protein/predicted Ser/Thr protein kinase